MISCPLCNHPGTDFQNKDFFLCVNCKGIFKSKESRPNPLSEKARYELHKNDPKDKGYFKFISPVINAILETKLPLHEGLDFGAGPGSESGISSFLKEKGYQLELYDPFFHNIPELLTKSYDYIICCEVMEHFHDPAKEFVLLKNLLKPEGILYCMTHIYHPENDFKTWYYKNDFTHVFFYQKETLEYICETFGFSGIKTEGRLVQFFA